MPSGTTVRDIGTFTIWCERFTAIFTRLEFPANIVIPDGGGGFVEEEMINQRIVSL